MNTGPKKFLGLPQPLKRGMYEPLEMVGILGRAVCQRSLEIVPNKLVRIELGRISGEAISVQARMIFKKLFDQVSLMRPAAIPQKDHMAAQMFEQLPQESDDLKGADVFIAVKSRVEREALSSGRYAKGRDGRNLGPVSGATQNWSLSPGSPCPGNIRDQEESTLVEERQMGSKFFGFFLYAASRNVSTSRWPLRFFPEPSFRAFGSSSPNHLEFATNDSSDSRSQSAVRSPLLHGAASTDRSNSRNSALPSTACASMSVFRDCSILGAGRERAWPSSPTCPSCETSRAIKRRSPENNQSWRLPPKGSVPFLAVRRRVAAALRAVPDFHGVACGQHIIFSITYA